MNTVEKFLLGKYQRHLDYFKSGEVEKFREFYVDSDAIEKQIEFLENKISDINFKYQ